MERFSRSIFIVCSALMTLTGCFATVPPLTKDDALKFPTISNLVEERHKPLGLGRWYKGEDGDRYVVQFKSLWLNHKDYFNDLTMYCDAKGGSFKDYRDENRQKLLQLREKYTKKVESKRFECGPEGRAEYYDDWTKFNPAVCRKRYENVISEEDKTKIDEEFGRPAGYACVKGESILYMGTIYTRQESKSFGMEDTPESYVRLNEGKSGSFPVSERANMK